MSRISLLLALCIVMVPCAASLAAAGRPSPQHHPGKVVWADLITPALPAAEDFYGKLFDWTFRPDPSDPGHVTAYAGKDAVAGFIHPARREGQHPAAWVTYFAGSRFDEVQRAAIAHGAQPLLPPRTYPERGRLSILKDPEGAVFGVLAGVGGDFEDHLAKPDHWIWSALMATQPDGEAAFYEAVFGYQGYAVTPGAGTAQVILASDGYARASVNAIAADRPSHPRWIDFVRVDDVARAAANAVALGGEVVVAPHIDRHGARAAMLRDPSGAYVGVMEWRPAAPGAVP